MATGQPVAFFGMRGSGEWNPDERPLNWRETIMYLYPNGRAPLTAILSMMGSEKTTDPTFNWWSKRLAEQGGDVTNVYTDSILSTVASTAALPAGTILYVKVAAAVVKEFRIGHQAALINIARPEHQVVGDVIQVSESGAESYICVKTLNAFPAGVAPNGTVNYIWVVGNANAEGATIPDSIAYDPKKYSNHTQIHRTPLSITRTAMKTKLRTKDGYQRARQEALEIHSIEMEKAFLFSEYGEDFVDGKPKRFMRGFFPAMREYVPENVHNYAYDADYAGVTWKVGGEDWLDQRLEEVHRYGKGERIFLMGSGALLGLKKTAAVRGTYEFTQAKGAYGISLTQWDTPWGTHYIKTHPLFAQNAAYRNTIAVITPEHFKIRHIDDTFFKKDDEKSSRNNGRDGRDEEYLTENSLEYHFLDGMAVWHGVGLDNKLTP